MSVMTTDIGLFVIFGVVLVPLYIMLGGWFFGKPRDLRTTLIGVGYLVSLVAAVVVGVWLIGFLLDFVVTY